MKWVAVLHLIFSSDNSRIPSVPARVLIIISRQRVLKFAITVTQNACRQVGRHRCG